MAVDRTHTGTPRTHPLVGLIKVRRRQLRTKLQALTHRATRHLWAMAHRMVNNNLSIISKDLEHQVAAMVRKAAHITHKVMDNKVMEEATINHNTANSLTMDNRNREDSQVMAATPQHQTTNTASSSQEAMANTLHHHRAAHSTVSLARLVLPEAMVANKAMEDSPSHFRHKIQLVSTRATTHSKADMAPNRAAMANSSKEDMVSRRILNGNDVWRLMKCAWFR